MNYILINSDNISDFEGVLPPDYHTVGKRVSLGAYEDDGKILGSISVRMADDEYELDWLYVVPSYRRRGVAKGLFEEITAFISEMGTMPLTAWFEVSEDDDALYRYFLSLKEEPIMT